MTNIKIPTEKIPLLVIAGPTASGKTALSVELAKKFGGEIVCADSMQIYKDIYIGTARVTPEEAQGIEHHLCGFLPLGDSFSTAQYVEKAEEAIKDIYKRGKLPVMCGGTGLYISSLINNVKFSNAAPDEKLRNSLMEKDGGELLAELSKIDPESAERLYVSDKKRIVRALEVYYTTGKTIIEHNRLSKLEPSKYEVCLIGLNYLNRDILYNRIEKRVDIMMEQGLLDEARLVLENPNAKTVIQAIGYKEFLPYFNGECTVSEAVEVLKLNTRHYAKRQITWFKREEKTVWLYPDEYKNSEEILEKAVNIFKETEAYSLWKKQNQK